jgi:dolichol kinase
MLPLRIDDNLTIPLAVGFSAWIVCALLGVAV